MMLRTHREKTLATKMAAHAKPQPLRPGCGHCGKNNDALKRCSRCRVKHYCSGEHQTTDFQTHKTVCGAVSRARSKLEREDALLRAHKGDIDTPPDAFSTAVGKFWGYQGTRPYMLARYELVDALGGVNSFEAVKEQVTHVLGMLLLCHSDNLGLRLWAPFVMLRADMDQEGYNYIQWALTNDEINQDNWRDWKKVDLTKPGGKNMNVFEGVEYLVQTHYGFIHLGTFAAMALLKTKLFLDLYALQAKRDRSVLSRLNAPRHLLSLVEPFAPRSPVVRRDNGLLNSTDLTVLLVRLELQIYQLYTCIMLVNKHFWRVLFNPGDVLENQPSLFGYGSEDEAKFVVGLSYSTWVETPGAMEYIKGKSASGDWAMPPGVPT